MSISWTKSQENAIFARDVSLAVSAAAGSGKTSVLTHRIINLLAEGKVQADRLVVVTFTKAAAKSLSDKLYRALSDMVAENPENKNLSRQLMALSRAQISTIHSFCYTLIRSYYKELDLPGNLSIADPCRIKQMKEKAIKEGVEEFLTDCDEKTLAERKEICRLFGTARSLNGLYDTLFTLFEKVSSLPGGLSSLQEKNKQLKEELSLLEKGEIKLSDTSFAKPVIAAGIELFTRMEESFSALLKASSHTQLLDEKYGPFLEKKIALAGEIRSLVSAGEFFTADKLLTEGLSSMPRIYNPPPEEKECKEEISEIYNALKKEALAFSKNHFKSTVKELVEEISPALTLGEDFLFLASLCESRFTMAKRQKGLLDYGDLENLALKLVCEKKDGKWQKTCLGEKITGEFDAVFVDEYQDSNAIQDLLFRGVSREDNLFIVGDPKQSIYRFRGAEPSIFSDYKNRLPKYPSPQGKMQSIFLSHNFRSEKPILEVVNRIFAVMMDSTAPESLYKKEDMLCYGPEIPKPAPDVSLYFVDKEEEEEDKDLPDGEKIYEEENLEAKFIATSIRGLLSQYQPEDIAVICRTHRQIALVEKSLSLLQIPCSQSGAGNFAENPEFLFVHSLLLALDNPTSDVPLLGTLLSPVFAFTSDDLYGIRKEKRRGSFYSAVKRAGEAGDEKCLSALEKLKILREESKRLSLSALIFHLYRTLSISQIFSHSSSRVKDFFLSLASLLEGMGEDSLSAFARYALRAAEEDKESDEEEPGVRLMTIHKSKGLEYPVVFASFLGQNFDTRDESGKLIFSSDLGCVFHTPGLSGRARINHFLRKGARIGLHRDMIEEEKRVLYVALTRAKEKLIITAKPRSYNTVKRCLFLSCPEPLSHRLSTLMVQSAKSPLTLLLSSLRESQALRTVFSQGGEASEEYLYVAKVYPEDAPLYGEEEKKEEKENSLSEIFENLSFTYEEKDWETLPKKLSVSELVRFGREEEGDLIPYRLLDFEKGALLSNAARIGTATHQVMQFASLSALKENPEEEYARLEEKGFLTPSDLALVEKEKIAHFFTTPLYEKMASSPNLVREKRFNVLLPACELLGREGEVLVQGVVDAWFENEDGTLTLLDFKTDRVKEEETLVSRHRDQLLLYAKALTFLTGKTVRDIYLYSFALGKEILLSF